jgi:hypothetical protein
MIFLFVNTELCGPVRQIIIEGTTENISSILDFEHSIFKDSKLYWNMPYSIFEIWASEYITNNIDINYLIIHTKFISKLRVEISGHYITAPISGLAIFPYTSGIKRNSSNYNEVIITGDGRKIFDSHNHISSDSIIAEMGFFVYYENYKHTVISCSELFVIDPNDDLRYPHPASFYIMKKYTYSDPIDIIDLYNKNTLEYLYADLNLIEIVIIDNSYNEGWGLETLTDKKSVYNKSTKYIFRSYQHNLVCNLIDKFANLLG